MILRGKLGLGTLENKRNPVGFAFLLDGPPGRALPTKSKAYGIELKAARPHKVCPARVFLKEREAR